MPERAQGKLLRFLQDRLVLPLGATRARQLDVRVMAATSRPLEGLRSDLLGRFGARVEIPPLRDRIEDVGALVAYFGRDVLRGVEPAAFRALCLHSWPYNVRELRDVVEQALAQSDGGRIRVENLPDAVRAALESGPRLAARRPPRAPPSRDELAALLSEHRGNIAAIARALDRHWTAVHRWLQRHGLDVERFRG
jgi:transcriptional regulator of acetoin/glycerol metabolism